MGTRLKKNFSGVSTMCLQLGSGTNQLDGVNEMMCSRQTSDLVWIIFHDKPYSGDYFPQCFVTNICQ